MLIKAREYFNDEIHGEYLSIEEVGNNVINVTYGYKGNSNENFTVLNKTIDLAAFFQPIVPYSVFVTSDGCAISDPTRVNLTKDVNMGFYRFAYEFGGTILTIYFNTSVDEVMLISRVPYLGECELYDKKQKGLECILEKYPEFGYRYGKRTLKHKLLANIDWGESLAALEAQLDYVTLILNTILEEDEELKNKVAKKLTGLDQFFEICDTKNTLTIKPEEKLFFDIVEQKKLVRNEQSRYWKELEKLRHDEV